MGSRRQPGEIDAIIIDLLKKGPATTAEIGTAIGYDDPQSASSVVNRLRARGKICVAGRRYIVRGNGARFPVTEYGLGATSERAPIDRAKTLRQLKAVRKIAEASRRQPTVRELITGVAEIEKQLTQLIDSIE